MAHLSWGVSSVPQGVPQVLTRSSGGVDHFDGQTRVALGSRWCVGPVCLCYLFPHDSVESWAGLVAENKAGVVIVSVGVDEEGSTEIHSAKLIVAWNNTEYG